MYLAHHSSQLESSNISEYDLFSSVRLLLVSCSKKLTTGAAPFNLGKSENSAKISCLKVLPNTIGKNSSIAKILLL